MSPVNSELSPSGFMQIQVQDQPILVPIGRELVQLSEAIPVLLLELDIPTLSTAPDSFFSMVSFAGALSIATKFMMFQHFAFELPGSADAVMEIIPGLLAQASLSEDHFATHSARFFEMINTTWGRRHLEAADDSSDSSSPNSFASAEQSQVCDFSSSTSTSAPSPQTHIFDQSSSISTSTTQSHVCDSSAQMPISTTQSNVCDPSSQASSSTAQSHVCDPFSQTSTSTSASQSHSCDPSSSTATSLYPAPQTAPDSYTGLDSDGSHFAPHINIVTQRADYPTASLDMNMGRHSGNTPYQHPRQDFRDYQGYQTGGNGGGYGDGISWGHAVVHPPELQDPEYWAPSFPGIQVVGAQSVQHYAPIYHPGW